MNTDTITRVAESLILEAIEEGKFDNLPGKGKPIVFEDDLSIPQHVRMANKVLKNAGVAPEWVQFRQDILEERKAVQSALQRLSLENRKRIQRISHYALDPKHPHLLAYAEWHRKARLQYQSMLKSVNTSILKFCMNAPSSVSAAEAFAPYRIDAEMSQFDEAFPPLADLPGAAPTGEQSEGVLRSFARSRYGAISRTKSGEMPGS